MTVSARATRHSWEIEPMPERRERIELEQRFSRDEYERLACGHIPESQDDRWFVYVDEDDVVHIHRSATGFAIFEIELAHADDGYWVQAAWANRDPEQGMDPAFDSVAGSLLRALAQA
ncbi:MAG: hypothetical protein ACJ75P_04225 [Gaiellaceae bacterium]